MCGLILLENSGQLQTLGRGGYQTFNIEFYGTLVTNAEIGDQVLQFFLDYSNSQEIQSVFLTFVSSKRY